MVISPDNYPPGRRDRAEYRSKQPEQPSDQPVVVIVVSRLKSASPLTRNLRLTSADSISSRSANACIIHNQFPNPKLEMNRRPGQLPPSFPPPSPPPSFPWPPSQPFEPALSYSFHFFSSADVSNRFPAIGPDFRLHATPLIISSSFARLSGPGNSRICLAQELQWILVR